MIKTSPKIGATDRLEKHGLTIDDEMMENGADVDEMGCNKDGAKSTYLVESKPIEIQSRYFRQLSE